MDYPLVIQQFALEAQKISSMIDDDLCINNWK